MMGCFAGQLLYSEEKSVTARKAWMLAGIGAALIVAGLLMSPWFPIIKKIWSSSMTLLSGGICYLLMAVTYYLIDVRKCPLEMKGIASFGMNSIAVYMIGQKVKFTSVSQSLLFGLEQFTGAYYPLVIAAGNALILCFIIRVMYRYKIFLKV
jgi:predicted acyltransferase